MSYSSIVEMTTSASLHGRIAACAAEEGVLGDPTQFTRDNIWTIIANGNWDQQWDSAKASASPNVNPDTGARDDVITDSMILSVVQPMVKPPEPEA